MVDLSKLLDNARTDLEAASDEQSVEAVRVEYLGRKGSISQELRSIKDAPIDRRAELGKTGNRIRLSLEKEIEQKLGSLREASLNTESTQHTYDLTAPGRQGAQAGHVHPVESLQAELIQYFWQLGFNVAEGPEIETDWYCFEALNIPADHPARDMQDTFYLENGTLPRTHTSSVQIRYMEQNKPPIRIISPGKVYRNEDEDATHIWSFRQLEGIVVDEGVSLADLKGTLLYMLRAIFGQDAELRLRPNYFPYVEPALEVDVRVPGGEWLELLGAGMIHPQVLRNVGIDPDVYSGFAFGVGLERLAAVRHQVPDLRGFWRTDLRQAKQF